MRILLIVTLAALASSCASDRSATGDRSRTETPRVEFAHANMKDASGADIGQIRFHQTRDGLEITGELTNLQPGEHGLHIHQKPSCEAPDFKSAGDHFNPTNREHGDKNPKGSHVGDLQNIFATSQGAVKVGMNSTQLALYGLAGILENGGTAIVVHAKPDDRQTDPSGGSGDRVACGQVRPGNGR